MLHINDAAHHSKLSAKAIRFYEKQGLIKPSRTVGNNYRTFTTGDVERLRVIRLAREAGFSVEEIRAFINADDKKAALAYVTERQRVLKQLEFLLS